MVLDPMSAFSLAANIVQFVDFTIKIVSKGRRIYLSKDGALPKNLELEVVTNDLSRLAESLRNDGIRTGTLSEEEISLQTMCEECSKIAEELLRRLEKLKVKSDAKQRGWKSLRQALKSVWNKEELDELSERLMQFRDQLQFRTLVSMNKNLGLQTLQQSERFDDLDQAGKSLLSALINNKSIFSTEINGQTITITDLHLETRSLIQKEAKKTRAEILNTLKLSESVSIERESRNYIVSGARVTDSWDKHDRIQTMILQSLRFPTMTDRHDAIKEAHAETFEWIFRAPEDVDKPWDDFSDWLQHGDGFYWISGKAGSGKSTLMRYIQDNPHLRTLLQKWTTQDENLVIATFFFWISGVADQSSQVGLLRSLLFELLSSKPHLIEATLSDLWSILRSSVAPAHDSITYSWTLSRVTSCFKRLFSIISQDTGRVFLLIDGLDEYKGDPTDTIELFRSIISPNVKICVSSRPWQAFEVAFKKCPKLRLQDLTYGDIKRYVTAKLLGNEQMQQLCASDPVGAPQLVEEIVGKAEGVFLWVTLVVKSFLNGLSNGDSIYYLRKRLEEIPSEIEGLYLYMLSKVQAIYREEGRRLFSTVWLAFHRELKYVGVGISAVHLSFTLRDSEDLAASHTRWNKSKVISIVDWMDSRLRICCAGLLELSNLQKAQNICLDTLGDREIQYIHRTARDFLALGSQRNPVWICPEIADQVPVRMMRANVIYLKSCVRTAGLAQMDSFIGPFIGRMMWLAHKAERETRYHNAEILDAFEDSASQLFDSSFRWVTAHLRETTKAAEDVPNWWCDDFLSLAVVWKLNLYLEKKLGHGNKVLEAKTGRPYLDYALRHMDSKEQLEQELDLKTISILLEHGGDPNRRYAIADNSENDRYLNQSTPWETVLFSVNRRRRGDIYDRHAKPEEFFASFLVPLFELMLRHGADPRATPFPNTILHFTQRSSSSISVEDIIYQYSKICPEKSRHLSELLKAAKDRFPRTPPVPPMKVGPISRLKRRLQLHK